MHGTYELFNQDNDTINSGMLLSIFTGKNGLLAANLQTLFVFTALEKYRPLNVKYHIAQTSLNQMGISVVGVETGK